MHEPVLLKEVVELLNIKKDGRYVDATLGLGGHAEGILKELGENGRLLGLDVDSGSLVRAESRLQPFGNRSNTRRSNFRGLQGVLRDLAWPEIDGIVADLGISSYQLDAPERGFTFQKDGPLDMRLDPEGERSALSLLRTLTAEELSKLLRQFGENRFAGKMTAQILEALTANQLHSTGDLARLCERIAGGRGKIHPATRVFLALRAKVNDELGALEDLLSQIPDVLAVNGRAAIISFHSLEDRMVKSQFRFLEQNGFQGRSFVRVTKKPVLPSEAEMQRNPRSRSAKLRVIARVS